MDGFGKTIRWAGVAALLLAGCVTPQNTRMPTLAYGDPKTERQSYSYHDPLPETMNGPGVERPRGAERQRPEPRRAIEQSIRPMSGEIGASAERYPDSVRP
ncbi:MAG: hypothetical protein ACKV0T_19885 [Planctomycetales bacterium]